MAEGFFEAVFDVARNIPRGRVMTYGQIARLLGRPGAARMVGYAMHGCRPKDKVPWHRVINGRGRISAGDGADIRRPLLQRKMLEAEGVFFDDSGRCDLAEWQWRPEENGGKKNAKVTR